MTRISATTLLWLLALTANASEIVAESFDSRTLDRAYTYLAYVPDGYGDDESVRYPVLYLLHGSFSEATFWTDWVGVQAKLDTLIDNGDIPPTIAIMPNANSWWIDGRNEAAETAFFDDLLPHIESRWSVSGAREDRLLAGVSAGGFATVNFALKYPEKFAAGAPLSPASYAGMPPENSTAYQHPAFLDDEGNFDEALWTSVNYPAWIDAYEAQDIVVPLYINSGDHDGLDIAYHAAVLYQRLRQHQPEQLELRIVDGDHEVDVWVRTFADAVRYLFSVR